ncbi:flocculation protein FLO11-like isoform X2 [Folsomia candida]|uniref:flocculation protein FLO11-like isoform X2 n=1 Tax=Folsomia candida TaxID=158441 RepID=UPI00160525BB|nr:flocculation protein FLO11-like isoform X2 [Folsomia candida]
MNSATSAFSTILLPFGPHDSHLAISLDNIIFLARHHLSSQIFRAVKMTATQASQTTYCSGCDELKETVAKLQQQLCKMETISSDLVRGLTCLKSLIVPPTPPHNYDSDASIDLEFEYPNFNKNSKETEPSSSQDADNRLNDIFEIPHQQISQMSTQSIPDKDSQPSPSKSPTTPKTNQVAVEPEPETLRVPETKVSSPAVSTCTNQDKGSSSPKVVPSTTIPTNSTPSVAPRFTMSQVVSKMFDIPPFKNGGNKYNAPSTSTAATQDNSDITTVKVSYTPSTTVPINSSTRPNILGRVSQKSTSLQRVTTTTTTPVTSVVIPSVAPRFIMPTNVEYCSTTDGNKDKPQSPRSPPPSSLPNPILTNATTTHEKEMTQYPPKSQAVLITFSKKRTQTRKNKANKQRKVLGYQMTPKFTVPE